MSLGALSLIAGAGLTGVCLSRQHENNLAVHEVNNLAQQISVYHPQIAAELEKADQLAAQIGDQVDPDAAKAFANLRTAAQNVLAVEPPKPIIGDKPKQVEIDREIIEGIIAANTNLVDDLEAGEAKLEAAHAAYLLNLSKGPARAAAEALDEPLHSAQATIAGAEGNTWVPKGLVESLQAAIDNATEVQTKAGGEYGTTGEYDAIKNEAMKAKIVLQNATNRVINSIPIAADDEGNPIYPEPIAMIPEYVPAPNVVEQGADNIAPEYVAPTADDPSVEVNETTKPSGTPAAVQPAPVKSVKKAAEKKSDTGTAKKADSGETAKPKVDSTDKATPAPAKKAAAPAKKSSSVEPVETTKPAKKAAKKAVAKEEPASSVEVNETTKAKAVETTAPKAKETAKAEETAKPKAKKAAKKETPKEEVTLNNTGSEPAETPKPTAEKKAKAEPKAEETAKPKAEKKAAKKVTEEKAATVEEPKKAAKKSETPKAEKTEKKAEKSAEKKTEKKSEKKAEKEPKTAVTGEKKAAKSDKPKAEKSAEKKTEKKSDKPKAEKKAKKSE